MSKEDTKAIWDEITSLREDVDELKFIKNSVAGSIGELKELTQDMKERISRMDDLITQVQEITT